MAVKPAPRKSAMGGRGKAAAAVPGRRNAILSKGVKPGRKTLPNAVAGRTGAPVSARQPRAAASEKMVKNSARPANTPERIRATGGAGGPELGTGYPTRRPRMSDTARAIAAAGAGAARAAKSTPVKSTRGGVGSMNSNVGKAAAKRPAKPKYKDPTKIKGFAYGRMTE